MGNALVEAKKEGERKYQELMTKNEVAAQHLKNIAKELAAGHAALEEMATRAATEEGRLVAEAYAEHGDDYNSFTAWWNDPDTWIEATGLPDAAEPFPRQKALTLKRLHDFCSGSMIGKAIGRPKNPDGITQSALTELLAPKYVRDKAGRELNKSNDERTPESQERLDVVESVYKKLKDRAVLRANRAKKKGVESQPITTNEVKDALQKAFKEADMVLVHKTVRRTSLKDVLNKIDREMSGWYFTFEGDEDALAAMRSKVADCLAEWDEWEGG